MKIQDLVKKNDPENLFQVLVDTYKQVEYSSTVEITDTLPNSEGIQNVIITGLGGSAIAGDLFKNVFAQYLKVPVSVNRNYTLPVYADKNTLLIASSYSGATEETLSAFDDGVAKGCKIVCISTGGELTERAKRINAPVFVLKKGFQPRYSLGLSFFALVSIFSKIKLIPEQGGFISESIALWKQMGDELSQDYNRAYNQAEGMLGTVPIVYGIADVTDSIAVRCKSQFNENSKIHSFHNNFPELNHNEIIGWETHQKSGIDATVIILSDSTCHPQIKKRISITTELLRSAGSEVVIISGDQGNFQLRMMEIVYYLDWVTYYFAILRAKDPGEIDFIHLLKRRLAE